jgi:carboxymethylenebutenolidase
MNARWHADHPMPKPATVAQRFAWHLAHQKHCGCRPMPSGLAAIVSTGEPALTSTRSLRPLLAGGDRRSIAGVARARRIRSRLLTEGAKDDSAGAEIYVARPKGAPRGGVLVLHAFWGLNAFVRRVCDRLAREGFLVMAPDLFEGQVATTPAEAERLRRKPKRQAPSTRVTRAAGHLTREVGDAPGIGVIGFSYGGHWAAWYTAHPTAKVAATVMFYAARVSDFTTCTTAIQAHFAEQDAYVSAAARARFEKALRAREAVGEVFVYPGTRHWFVEEDRPDAYDARAARLAWRRTLTFLSTHVARRARPKRASGRGGEGA